MTERRLRAGLVGLGTSGRVHVAALGTLAGVDLVGIADPRGDRHDVAAGRPVVETVEQLVMLGVDYCVVAVPTAAHLAVGLVLAESGVPTLMVRPLAGDLASAHALVGAFGDAGVLGAVGQVERYHPALVSARARLARGDIGALRKVTTRSQGPTRRRATIGEDTIHDLATRDLDITSWVTGLDFHSLASRSPHPSDQESAKLLSCKGILADGTKTKHLVNGLSPLTERTTVIAGERGALVVDAVTGGLSHHGDGHGLTSANPDRSVDTRSGTACAVPPGDPMQLLHRAMRDVVGATALPGSCRTGGTAAGSDLLTMREALGTAAAVEAVARSGRTDGQSVETRPALQPA